MRASQSVHHGDGCKTHPHASMIHWDSLLPSSFFPFKNCHDQAVFGVCLRTWIHLLPRLLAFWLKKFSLWLQFVSPVVEWWAAEPESGNTNFNMDDKILERQCQIMTPFTFVCKMFYFLMCIKAGGLAVCLDSQSVCLTWRLRIKKLHGWQRQSLGLFQNEELGMNREWGLHSIPT